MGLLETLERWAVKLQPPTSRIEPLPRHEGSAHVVSIKTPVVLGAAAKIRLRTMSDTCFKARVVHTNVPCPNAMLLKDIKIGNIGMFVSGGVIDAYQFRKGACGLSLDISTIEARTMVAITVRYTGLVPEGMKAGDVFDFEITLEGSKMLLSEDGDHALGDARAACETWTARSSHLSCPLQDQRAS